MNIHTLVSSLILLSGFRLNLALEMYTEIYKANLILTRIGSTWHPIYTKLKSNYIDFLKKRLIVK